MPFYEDLQERKDRAFSLFESLILASGIMPGDENFTEDIEKLAERACHCELIFNTEWEEKLRRQGVAF